MAVLVIGVVAALLVALTLGLAHLVETRALRAEIARLNKTQHRIALVEGGRYRSLKRTQGERAGRRADHENRISAYARASLAELKSLGALLACVVAPEGAAVEPPATLNAAEDREASDRLTSTLPEASAILATSLGPPRSEPRSARAPLAHPDLIGSEDIAEEAALPRLGPNDETPPRQGRAPMLVRAFQAPTEGGPA